MRDAGELSPGEVVRIRILDCENFQPAACSYLARALTGSRVTFAAAYLDAEIGWIATR